MLNAQYPDCEIDAHVVTWAGMNDAHFFRVFDFATVHELDPAKFRAAIESSSRLFAFKFPETVAFNTLSMFCCWNEAAALAEGGGADVVLKARVDNTLLPLVPSLGLLDHLDGLSIPAGGNYRNGVGDHVCHGSPALVAAYLRLFAHLPAYAAAGFCLHPERLLALHVSRTLTRPPERTPVAVFYRDGIYNRDILPDGSSSWPSDLGLSVNETLSVYRRRNLLSGPTAANAFRLGAAALLRSRTLRGLVQRRFPQVRGLFPLQ